MAQTERGIVYPDDYSRVADVPADMEAMAESIDAIIGTMEENIDGELENKVEKEEGKGLSQNDFNNTYKGNVEANTTARHTHSNKLILDLMTAYFTAEEKEKLDDLENYDDTELSGRMSTAEGKIEDIETEQITQNTAISNNKNNIEALQLENERLRKASYKLSGNGENITLNKTAEMEFVIPPLPEGNIKQNTTTGKNLFNKNSSPLLLGSTVEALSTGVRVSQSDPGTWRGAIYPLIDVSNYVGKVARVSTKVSVNGSNQPYVGLVLCDSAGGNRTSLYSTTSTGNVSIQATIPTLGASTYLGLSVDSNSNGTGVAGSYCDYEDLIITIDNSDMTYEEHTGIKPSPNPDYPQEVQVVKGNVQVKVENENFLPNRGATQTINNVSYTVNDDKSVFAKGTAVSDNSDFYLIGDKTNYVDLGLKEGAYNFGGCIDGTGQTYMLFMVKKDINDSITYHISTTTNGLVVNISKGDTFRIFIRVLAGISVNAIFYPQLVFGSTPSPYTPHQEQILPLTLGNLELCKIGDYKDYPWKDLTTGKWYWHKEIGKVVLDGVNKSFLTRFGTNVSDHYRFVASITDIKNQASGEIANVYCDKFIPKTINDTYREVEGIAVNDVDYRIIIYYDDLKEMTVVNANSWLITNNITLYYVLEEPTDTEITDTTLINQLEAITKAISYYEQTNISGTSSGISPLFDVTAVADMNLLLDPIEARLTLVES